jgi:hypothetical protein
LVVHSVPERRPEVASSVNLSEAQDDATTNPKQTGVRFHPHFLVDGVNSRRPGTSPPQGAKARAKG